MGNIIIRLADKIELMNEECIKYLIEKGADLDRKITLMILCQISSKAGYKQALDLLNKSERKSENPDDMKSDKPEQILQQNEAGTSYLICLYYLVIVIHCVYK